eukprot:4178869-Alexandrium_andersonii.AAC.1
MCIRDSTCPSSQIPLSPPSGTGPALFGTVAGPRNGTVGAAGHQGRRSGAWRVDFSATDRRVQIGLESARDLQ